MVTISSSRSNAGGGSGGNGNYRWTVVNSNSFASVNVLIPPQGGSINTETDAVVTMSGNIDVQGKMSGGLLGALGRMFLTNESFFTTSVTNTASESYGDVLIAPSSSGGIVLHQLQRGYPDLLLTKGSYLASDTTVEITSEIQKGSLSKSLMSGTGFFLLRAHTKDPSPTSNMVALAAYGSIHKYELKPNEIRYVDNGHLVAWTANMNYNTTFASPTSIWNSISSGEGIMCEFVGPGTLYLQSHKPDNDVFDDSGKRRRTSVGSRGNHQRGSVGVFIGCIFFLIFCGMLISMIIWLVSIFGTVGFDTNMNFQYEQSPPSYSRRPPRPPQYTREL